MHLSSGVPRRVSGSVQGTAKHALRENNRCRELIWRKPGQLQGDLASMVILPNSQ